MEKISGVLHIILSLVEDKFVGRTVMIKILKGSKSKEILMRNLHTCREFGALYWLSENVIRSFIDQLFVKDYLKCIDVGENLGLDFQVFKVKLTEKGKLALLNKEDLTFEISDEIKKEDSRIGISVELSLILFNELKSVSAVAERRSLVVGTIYDHLEECIRKKLLDVNSVISSDRINNISEVLKAKPNSRLKEIKESLNPEISYGEIRCVNASMN